MSRINYRNYPILEKIKKGDLGELNNPFYDLEIVRLEKQIKEEFSKYCPHFSSNVFHVSDAFLKAVEASRDKLRDILLGLDYFKCEGTMLVRGEVFMYILEREGEGMRYVSWDVEKDGRIKQIGLPDPNTKKGDVSVKHSIVSSLGYGFKDHQEAVEYSNATADLVLLIEAFKRFAKVEIVDNKARTKIHDQGCKYLNETDLDIQYLDSKWFTELVNSKGFKVRGFFRLQPKKKDGEWTKELIWIDEFEKKGYNRKAGIENIN